MTEARFAPWADGDIFVGATVLNNEADDHAGRGRILQYDQDLQPKGQIWVDASTHLVGGLKFDARGVLWAFDSQSFTVLNVHRDGRVEKRDFPKRAFSHVNFLRDGTLLFGEHAVGETIKPEIAARMKTTLPRMPGTDRFGDGHVFRFKADGTLVREYATATHGGMGGFLGVTMSCVSPDESTLIYCSETGPRLMRYDLVNDRQLPDLQSFAPPFPPGPPPMFFAVTYGPDGTLYVLRGGSIHVVDDRSGETKRQIPLEGFGWALMEVSRDGKTTLAANFFTGEVCRVDLSSGAKLGSIQTGAPKAVAGVTEYRGA